MFLDTDRPSLGQQWVCLGGSWHWLGQRKGKLLELLREATTISPRYQNLAMQTQYITPADFHFVSSFLSSEFTHCSTITVFSSSENKLIIEQIMQPQNRTSTVYDLACSLLQVLC